MKYILTESQFERIAESQEYLNQLLDKINSDGYDSLTHKEKDALIRISKGEEVHDEPQELPVSDEVYDPNRMFIHYVSRYKELEIGVDDLIFRLEPLGGTQTVEVLGEYHSFLIEPNFEENEVLILDNETDDVERIRYKNVPETTEGMRKLAVNFVYQKLLNYLRDKI
jgi:hypothetical protein